MTYGRKPKYQISVNAERQKQQHFFSRPKLIRVDPAPIAEEPQRLPIVRGGHWVLLTVAPSCEALSVRKLNEVRFPAWYPMGVFWRTLGFVKRRRLAPVFPGYVFAAPAGFADDTPRPSTSMLDVDHVTDIISDWDGTLLRHDRVVELLDEAMAAGHFDYTKGTDPQTGRKQQKFKIGQKVIIEDGPFASFPGVVEEVSGRFVKVAIEIFSRSTPAQLEIGQIRAA